MWGYWQVTFSSPLSLVSKVETTSSGTPASSSFFTHMWEVSSLRHDRKAIPSSDIFFFTTLNSSSSSPSSSKPFLFPASRLFFKYIKPGVLRLTLKIQIDERFEHSLVGDL